MKVLIACEFSGVVREAFRKRGHNAWSCDLLPTEIPGQHLQGDIFAWIRWQPWDLMIAHPPCTYLCNSGVRWLYDGYGWNMRPIRQEQRWDDMREAALFFKILLDADIPKIAVENPIPHKYAVEIIGRNYDQLIQPWQFGHGETKATCLWLKGLPPLIPTSIDPGREHRIHKMSPGPNRGMERSRTYQGIADAMASQWG